MPWRPCSRHRAARLPPGCCRRRGTGSAPWKGPESTAKSPETARPEELPTSAAPWQQPFTGDPVRLFRYSALTANSHRPHYGAPYAYEAESVPDWAVHGPVLKLLMAELAGQNSLQCVPTLDYRVRRPVFSRNFVLLTRTPYGNSAAMAVLNGDATVIAEAQLGLYD